MAEAGATLYNIIPLIPCHKLADEREPDCEDIADAREAAGKYMDWFLHCQHCRADAVGIPGVSDYSDQVYFNRLRVKETFSHG